MSYTLMSESKPRARKRHFCIWCGDAINKGEVYRHERSVYDGHWQDHKWHLECDEASEDHFRYQEEFCPYDNERPPHIYLPGNGFTIWTRGMK